MHFRKFLSIFLIGLVFAIAGCSGSSSSGSSDNELLPDTDNDGIVDKNDPDIDGDGILNKDDADDDGDGTPDATDPTPNGPGGEAPTPGLVCTSAKIIAPNDEVHTGKLVEVAWDLLPAGCGVQGEATGKATAAADGQINESLSVSPGEGHVLVEIPHNCDWTGTQEVTYSISQIGTALGDSSADTSYDYKQSIEHPVSSCTKDPAIANENIMRTIELDEDSCKQEDPKSATMTCKGTSTYWLWANNRQATPMPLSEYSYPTWDTTPNGTMSIYLAPPHEEDCIDVIQKLHDAGDAFYKDPPKKSAFYYTDDANGRANFTKLADAECKVAVTLNENPDGIGMYQNWVNPPRPGNFILKLNGTPSSITVRKFVAGD